MSNKHTPGPWYWTDRFPKADGERTWSLLGENGYGILCCDGEGNSPQGIGDAANALLIAAAPDLLEALQGLIRAGHQLSPNSNEWNAAHAAIAKATGANNG